MTENRISGSTLTIKNDFLHVLVIIIIIIIVAVAVAVAAAVSKFKVFAMLFLGIYQSISLS